TVNNSTAPGLVPIANMTVEFGSTADQAISATDPDGDAITFTFTGPAFMTVTSNTQVGNTRTGNIHLAPALGTTGTFSASVTATAGGASDMKSFTITVQGQCNIPPVLAQPANMTVNEGDTADQTITATDACGHPIYFVKVSGPLFMTVTGFGTGTATGNIHLAPGFSDQGTYAAVVRVSDGNLLFLNNDKSFTITVIGQPRCPVANAGGPYSGNAGVPVAFDGTASADPDGDALSYAWDFDASDGITVDATGPTPSHAYAAAGTFTVTLTVTETTSPFCSHAATTTATILSACDATVFNGYDVIRLASGKPTWFAFVQPANGCYSNADVVLSSFVLKYAGRQIPADFSKGSVETDKNGDGIQEIRVTFSKANLRTLFAGTGLGNGHNLVDVTIEANLTTGGALRGTTQIDVISNGDFSAASVSPNPLNPSATLTFTTTRQGFAKIELFDIAGRLVRTILDERTLAAGTHEVKIEGRGQRGETLASGVYFIRGVSADGKFTKAIAILK
ncbi:MAG TPA: PKD domain-containing protein, partial [Candidatus Limnocylindrales bacterium]|nr:PKD domain-containing protein [Candidatus Limnocylindrales bacterium]